MVQKYGNKGAPTENAHFSQDYTNQRGLSVDYDPVLLVKAPVKRANNATLHAFGLREPNFLAALGQISQRHDLPHKSSVSPQDNRAKISYARYYAWCGVKGKVCP